MKAFAVATLVQMGLFVANLALLPLAMTSMASTIQLLQQMGILPEVGTCSTCSFSTGAYTYKSEGMYNYLRCSNCKKKKSLLQNTVLRNSNTTLHDRWLDHSKHYVHPTDKNLHTNRIEGLWNKFKRWLPQAGNYNLEEYVYIFMWTEEQ